MKALLTLYDLKMKKKLQPKKTATSCTESPFVYLPPWKKIASEEALSQGIGKLVITALSDEYHSVGC